MNLEWKFKEKLFSYYLKKNYYLYLNISKNDLCKKIIKIKEILKLNIEILV